MIVNAKYFDLFQQGLKNVECIGYQDEKILMLIIGERNLIYSFFNLKIIFFILY